MSISTSLAERAVPAIYLVQQIGEHLHKAGPRRLKQRDYDEIASLVRETYIMDEMQAADFVARFSMWLIIESNSMNQPIEQLYAAGFCVQYAQMHKLELHEHAVRVLA